MAEYIEREAMIRRLEVTPILKYGIPAHVRDGVVDLVEKQPAADVVEVVYARWEYHGGDDDCEVYGFCTNCHRGNMTEDDIERLKPKYCPNCGARMDGDG